MPVIVTKVVPDSPVCCYHFVWPKPFTLAYLHFFAELAQYIFSCYTLNVCPRKMLGFSPVPFSLSSPPSSPIPLSLPSSFPSLPLFLPHILPSFPFLSLSPPSLSLPPTLPTRPPGVTRQLRRETKCYTLMASQWRSNHMTMSLR